MSRQSKIKMYRVCAASADWTAKRDQHSIPGGRETGQTPCRRHDPGSADGPG
jgi:hypothetical protein